MPFSTTEISRSKLAHPDLSSDGGATLHAAIATIYTKLGDQSNSRLSEHVGIADSATVEVDHNFGANLDELHVFIYTGTGDTKQLVIDPKAAANGYAWNEKVGSEELVLEVDAPASGGPHTFTVMVCDNRMLPELAHQLIENEPSTPAAGVIKTWFDDNGRGLTKNSLGAVGTQQTLTPVHVSSATFNALPGNHYICDTTSNAITATLPATIADYDVIQFSDAAKTFNTNNLTLDRNGNSVDSDAADLVLNTPGDGALLVGDNSASNWVRASSGGAGGSAEAGVNYFENGSFENDATTGVSATNITAAAEEAAPLIGTRSSKLTSTASVGEVDYTLTGIDNHIIDGGFILQTSGRYSTGAGAATGDWTVGVYNTTDAAYVAGPVDLSAPSEDERFELGFVPLTGKSYVLRVEFTDTTAGRELLVDQLQCSNTPLPSSPIVQDYERFLPAYSNATGLSIGTSSTSDAHNLGQIKRVGSDALIRVQTFFNGTGSSGSPLQLTMPTYKGESITIPDGEYNAGVATLNHPATDANSFDQNIRIVVTSGVIEFANNDNASSGSLNGNNFGQDAGSRKICALILDMMVPISEWSGDGITVTPNLKPAQTKILDENDITITNSNGISTWEHAELRGYRDSNNNYMLRLNIGFVATSVATSHTITIGGVTWKTGVANRTALVGRADPSNVEPNSTDEIVHTTSGSVNILAIQGEIPLASKPTWWDANVEATSVSTVIEEASAARAGIITRGPYFEAYDSTTASVSPSTPAVFTTVAADSHSAYNNSTGEFTTPETGLYNVTASFFSGSAGGSIRIYVDGVYKYQGQADLSSGAASQIAAMVFLTAGEVVTIRSSGSDTLGGLDELNWFSMARLG